MPVLQAQRRTFYLSHRQSSTTSRGPSSICRSARHGFSPPGSQLEAAFSQPCRAECHKGPILPTRTRNSHLPRHQYRKHHALQWADCTYQHFVSHSRKPSAYRMRRLPRNIRHGRRHQLLASGSMPVPGLRATRPMALHIFLSILLSKVQKIVRSTSWN